MCEGYNTVQYLTPVICFEFPFQMYARNLAIVFGPTLIRPRDDSMVLMVKDMSDQCRIIESIITHVGTSGHKQCPAALMALLILNCL